MKGSFLLAPSQKVRNNLILISIFIQIKIYMGGHLPGRSQRILIGRTN